jgi:biopolymer transport protein ExbB/TolQ
MSWETIRNLIHDEWVILLLLLVWSVAGMAVICERIYSLWGVLAKSEVFKNRVMEAVEKGDLAKATALCETATDPLGEVFGRGLRVYARTPQKTTEAVNSQRIVALAGFKRYLWALGTVGSSAPFVGLFGTVVGILKAFQSMSQAGTGGFKVVSQGIAAALVATAAGLLVAIYAIIAYNYFVAKIGTIGVQYKVFCEEFLLVLGEYGRSQAAPVIAPQAQASGKAPPS